MKIIAHPLTSGEFIAYLLDDTGRPLEAELRNSANEIIEVAKKMAKKHDVNNAQYVEDFSATSKKPSWKIIAN
jgi:hypothetical protein